MRLDLKKLVEGLGCKRTDADIGGDPAGRRAFATELVYEDDSLAPDEKTGIRTPMARQSAENKTKQAQFLKRAGWVDMGGEGEYAGEYWAHHKLTKGRPVSMNDALAQAQGGSIRARNESALRSFVRALLNEAEFDDDPLRDSISLDMKIEQLRKKLEAAKAEIYPDMPAVKRAAIAGAISVMSTKLRDLRTQRVASWMTDKQRVALDESIDERTEWDDELHNTRAWVDKRETAPAASDAKKTEKLTGKSKRSQHHKKPTGDK